MMKMEYYQNEFAEVNYESKNFKNSDPGVSADAAAVRLR